MNRSVPSQYESIVVQIATPYTTGTGFCLANQPIVVSNEHIVRDNKVVVIDHPVLGKKLAQVIFLDAKRDLALLQIPERFACEKNELNFEEEVKLGQKVFALGTMEQEEKRTKEGSITEEVHEVDGIPYLMHDAVLGTGDSGGPLFSVSGNLLGVNTFIRRSGAVVGLCLPARYIEEALEKMKLAKGRTVCSCYHCETLVFDDNPLGNICPNCGETIQLPSLIAAYQPVGIAATIEELLSETAPQIELSRKGPNSWQVQQGSAEINISYYEKNGLIVGDAHLCKLPSTDNNALYAFLLKQNFEIENLTFSIKDNDIVLSLMIYDRYLNEITGRTLFKYLFEQADAFDNILVEEYGAEWRI